MTIPPFAQSLIGPAVIAATLIGYDQLVRPRPEPYHPPLAAAAKEYRDTMPNAYHVVAEQVRAGVLSDKAAMVGALKEHAKPLAAALDSSFSPLVDASGKITNAPAAADLLEQASKALAK